MKKMLIFLLLIVTLFATITTATEYPVLTGYVNDNANLMNSGEELILKELIERIEKNTTVEIAVVTVQTTNGQARVEYANRLGDQNGVGKKATDNGVVILYSLENEKGGAIATGRGIESILNDAKVSRIGRASRHYFDEDNTFKGFETIILEIEKELDPTQKSTNEEVDNILQWFVIIIIAIALLVILIGAIVGVSDSGSGGRRRGGGGNGGSFMTGAYLGSSMNSNSSSFSSFGGFGGGGFGGGGGAF